MSSERTTEALKGAAEFFETIATGANPSPLIFSQAIRDVLATRFAFEVLPMDSAPSGEDALEPSEIEAHEGAWAIVYGTNAKPIGWVDTHAVFAGQTYRNRLLPPNEIEAMPKDWSLAWSSPHGCWQVTGANGWASDDYTFGVIGSGKSPVAAIQSALSNFEGATNE